MKKNNVTIWSESPLLGPTRKSVGCDDENFSSPKESRLRVLRGEAPSSPRRLVLANTAGGATRVAQLTPGQFIEHERFGIGEVLKVEGTGENTKATSASRTQARNNCFSSLPASACWDKRVVCPLIWAFRLSFR